jgi:hypothetical protein
MPGSSAGMTVKNCGAEAKKRNTAVDNVMTPA